MQPEQQQRIMGYFIEEAKDHLNTIEQGLLSLQSTIEDPEMMNELFRAAHSVKGGAAMLGLNSIQQVSHRLEDSFKILKDSPVTADQKLESLFLRVFDSLKELLEQLQGPFGLTADIADAKLSEVEPVFGELEAHLNGLVGAGEVSQPITAIPVSGIGVSGIAANLEPGLVQAFSNEVPLRLREMLELFKQPETDTASRQQLEGVCTNLIDLGEQFRLAAWCRLVELARQAIVHPENSYRILAPIVIKDLKQAQNRVLTGEEEAIVPAAQLQELVPAPATAVLLAAVDPFSDFLNTDSDRVDEPFLEMETDDLFGDLQLEPPLTAASDLSTADFSLDHESDEPLVTHSTAEHHGPEVGLAELNSLADLFEGEVPDLGSTWQEEEILDNTATVPGTASANPVEDDANADFSDLLFEEGAAVSDPDLGDDLSLLFGDDLLDEGTGENPLEMNRLDAGSSNLESLEDLLSISPGMTEGTGATTSDSADPFASLDTPADGQVTSGFASIPETESDLSDLDALFDDLDETDFPFGESEPGSESTPASADFDSDNLFASAANSDNPFASIATDADLPLENSSAAVADPWDDPQAIADPFAQTPEEDSPAPIAVEPEASADTTPIEELVDLGVDDGVDLISPFSPHAAPISDDLSEPIEELRDDDLIDFSSLLDSSPVTLPNSPETLVQDLTPGDSELSSDLWLSEPASETETSIPSGDDFSSEATTTATPDSNGFEILSEEQASADEELNLDLGDFDLGELADVTSGAEDNLFAEDLSFDLGEEQQGEVALGDDDSDDFNLGLEDFDLGDLDSQLSLTESTDLSDISDVGLDGEEGTVFSDSLDLSSVEAAFLTEEPATAAESAESIGDELDLGLPDFGLEGESDLGSDDLAGLDALFSESPTVPQGDDFSDLDSLLDGGADTPNDLPIFDTVSSEAGSPAASDDFAELDGLLGEEAPSNPPEPAVEEEPSNGFADLESLLGGGIAAAAAAGIVGAVHHSSATDAPPSTTQPDEFADLEALLGEEGATIDTPDEVSESSDTDFDELDDLLKDAEEKMGGSPSIPVSRGIASQSRRPARPNRVFSEQTMRVPVKHLDNLSNLVGELVVNRNSLEQDQERLRQSLDNLLYQVQQLSDVGQRMQDLYERSLLESSLLASRQSHRQSSALREGTETATATSSVGVEYDPLEMDRFTGFHSLSQEMIELIVRVRESASDIEFIVDETDQVTRMFRQVTTQLQEGLTRSRMVPFAQTADRMPRAVRDIAMKVGKQAELVIEGRETLIDKMILEQLYDPMTHLVNNAITHGIESPETRRSMGKPPTGRITIRAFHQGNQTIISVSDDGAGIDVERVKAKAIEKGLVTPAEARSISRLDIYDLLFHPGFSTKDQADDYSGRGVGMDVVRTSLSEIRGAISTDSNPNKGTTFTIRLPLTLSISKALCCISDRARIAFPMDGVEDMLDVPRERIQTNPEGQPCLPWRDSLLPLHPLNELLSYNRHLSRGNVYGGNQEDDICSIVVLRSAGNFLALQVDQVLGEQEIVIKQLEGPVPKPVGVAGATVLGDGRIMPIADVLELIDLAMGRIRKDSGGTLWDQSGSTTAQDKPATKTEPMVLIVDDSITVRELLSMTFNKVGYRVEQARDGQEAWEKLRSGMPCDIVFCDIEMPRMDGLELLSRIQKDPHFANLPIAMLTSRGADRHRQMAASLGASGYFTKPYLEEALLDAAQRMLKGEKLL
jgi:chemosensory pili system protein ChpA (sensor histidine kinase/response regulator)